MDENPVDNIGVVGNGNTNEKERNQEKKEICFFFLQVYYQVKNHGF